VVGLVQASKGPVLDYAQHGLPSHVQRFPAGGQHPQPGRLSQQHVGQLGHRIHQVLAVVQHQQQLPPGQTLRQRAGDRLTCPLPFTS